MSEEEALKNQEFICAYCIDVEEFKCDDVVQNCEEMNKLKNSYSNYLEKQIEQLQQENNHYKNISNELESWLEEHSKQPTNNLFFGGVTKGYEFALDKLKELKGSNK